MDTCPALREVVVPQNARIARYFPPGSGLYEVKPGLYPFGASFGNGAADQHVFQIDATFEQYREAKCLARSERLSKYYQVSDFTPVVAGEITGFILRRLSQEHPDLFQLKERADGVRALRCALTEEVLTFGADLVLTGAESRCAPVVPPYASALDALASQAQEDLAVVSIGGEDWVSALHVCCPSHWAAEDKIGEDFATVHAPVAGIERINRAARQMVNALAHRGPFVRFAWTLEADTRLNHHPEPPPGVPMERWRRQSFNRSAPRLFLRVERQTLWGFPNVGAFLFAIRTYLTDCEEIKKRPEECGQLRSAIASMTPESLAYKGLTRHRDDILKWLGEPSP
ncbi:MAG: hypothetical protein A3F84_26310 [Candidatus Handelsmanbacteria bacterium RIFCSPLOWO2_12_FULL_64_10]|uniref:DUF3445 domain-containing protein n=1 Tax=Handelsmanbacteria sp. (strain RIFCSPLOWO2_12_FULL_64_10) TaxID=1817868 RepID=A0A1F6CAP6_HANXR|nr:MAG: hypothetical protein A3F84_26310 [Candidatus Handelsmanbacteria bacterium RIFCSPLOWO2_12_FULL_64_10]